VRRDRPPRLIAQLLAVARGLRQRESRPARPRDGAPPTVADGAGLRPAVLVRLAIRGISARPIRAFAVAASVAVAVAAVVATSGRTEATRRAIIAHLEDPSARLIRVVSQAGPDGFDPRTIERLAALDAVEWIAGFGSAGTLVRNPSLGDSTTGNAGQPVGSRLFWGRLLGGPLIRLGGGRPPGDGEAVVGQRAAVTLGLADRSGLLDDERRGRLAAVGVFAAGGPVADLAAFVLVPGRADEQPTELLVLARRAVEVEAVVRLLPGLLGPGGERAAIHRADELLALRSALAAEAGALDGAVLLLALAASAFIVGSVLFGAIEARRREFGLRRTQGATRSTIGALIVAETTVLSGAGAVIGGPLGAALVVASAGSWPDLLLVLAVGVLVVLSAILGAIPPAIVAAVREPLYVLRSS